MGDTGLKRGRGDYLPVLVSGFWHFPLHPVPIATFTVEAKNQDGYYFSFRGFLFGLFGHGQMGSSL